MLTMKDRADPHTCAPTLLVARPDLRRLGSLRRRRWPPSAMCSDQSTTPVRSANLTLGRLALGRNVSSCWLQISGHRVMLPRPRVPCCRRPDRQPD
jgi:hypothetical protein